MSPRLLFERGNMNINYELTKEPLNELESKIGYRFRKRSNLMLALTHSSYANEKRSEKLQSNERLEFLGDAVLNIVISEAIYTEYTALTEGEMTKTRANIVCEASLAECAVDIGLGKYLVLGRGEDLTGGRARASILSDAFEALIGAVYIDGGFEDARRFVKEKLEKIMEGSINGSIFMDYKTQLQEIIQKGGEQKISYETVDEKGPDHSKLFCVEVRVSGETIGAGQGKSKKEAEQNAAQSAIKKVNSHDR